MAEERIEAQSEPVADRDQALASALHHYRCGRIEQAASLYRRLLQERPGDAEAMHLLGVMADAQDEPLQAIALIGQALRLRETPSMHSNLGMALAHAGRHDAALASYERALALRPDYPEALNNCGVSLEALQRPDEAQQAYRQATALRADYHQAWTNLGHLLRKQGRMDASVEAYENAVAHNPAANRVSAGDALQARSQVQGAEAASRGGAEEHPNDPDAVNNLAACLGELGRFDKVAALLPGVVAAHPDHPEAHGNLGLALKQLGRLEEAEAACRRAIALRPDYPEAHGNLGAILRELNRLAESEAALRRALSLRPTDAAAYNNLAITLQEQGRLHEARAVLDLAAALHPTDPETHHHWAMLLLMQGKFADGWTRYDWRFQTKQAGASQQAFLNKTPWRGESLAGRTILLAPEQGLGDCIQFARYAPWVTARGGRVILGVQKPLARLMRSLPGVAQIVVPGDAIPPYDLHCPMLSLPRAFGTTMGDIPASVPYLKPEPEAVARWKPRLSQGGPGLRVGIVWAGNPQHLNDRRRSVPFSALEELWRLPGLRWFSLQVGPRCADLGTAPPGLIDDLSPALEDLAETAAAIANLDLVISVDTCVAHLAGALACPVWVLLAAAADWRWLRSTRRSPWYPTMSLFRQNEERTWSPVVSAIAEALRAETAAGQNLIVRAPKANGCDSRKDALDRGSAGREVDQPAPLISPEEIGRC